ncbi:MAG: hypothetical protein IJE05_01065 [Clostridia bacterium]|nr:hypothetical protein [Clostridia bacterium]
MKTIKKNTNVTVKHILGETAEVLVTRLENGMYRFNCDAYAIGEYCKGGFFHLRQAREFIPGKALGNNIKFWPRLRKALHVSGLEPINIPGGDFPIHYSDEVVIPDYTMSGSHYFVIKWSDISKYLSNLPLDDAGKSHAAEIAKKQEEAAAEAYRQAHDPQCIAKRIGGKLWYSGSVNLGLNCEFTKLTLISDDNSEFSVIYPKYATNLLWSYCSNVPKVLCEAPEETDIKFLSGFTAGHLDPRNHNRIKKIYCQGWHCHVAYLMPNPEMASEVREHSRWLNMFDTSDNDGVSPELIANSKRIILEFYDLYDKLLNVRYVYNKDSEEVTKEYLHNWPFSSTGAQTGELHWTTEQIKK